MSPLTNAEKQRRWRQRMKAKAATAITVSTRDPETMTEEERDAEYWGLHDFIRKHPVHSRMADLVRASKKAKEAAKPRRRRR
jgi:hypothetical protein